MKGSVTFEEIERLKRDLNGAQGNLNTMLNNLERSAGLTSYPERAYTSGSIESPIIYGGGAPLTRTTQTYTPSTYQASTTPSFQTVISPTYQTIGSPSYTSTQQGARLSPPIRITSNTQGQIPTTIGATKTISSTGRNLD